MISNFKIFESLDDDMKVLATNTSYWSWEYNSNEVIAEILLDSNNSLYLKITKSWHSSGLGGDKTRSNVVEFESLGTLYKPNLKNVRSLLKKHANDNTSAGHGFSQMWQDKEGNKMSLTDLISLNRPEEKKPELKHIQSKNQFESDIELVKYSDRAYALFGEGTRRIKDKLSDLGCKYNKFLTDPNTGQKRPGWIFSINRLEKIKEIL